VRNDILANQIITDDVVKGRHVLHHDFVKRVEYTTDDFYGFTQCA